MLPAAPEEPIASPTPPPIDDEERAFRAGFARMVEWHRVAQARALWRAFWPGALVLLPLGSCTVALSMLQRSLPLTLLGLGITASGPVWAMVQLLRSMRTELYVAIRVDGLCVRLDPRGGERIYAWDRIIDARYDEATRVIQIALDDGEQAAIGGSFTALTLPELSRRIRDARRLAVWNRLSPRFGCAGFGEE
ncbi:MAG: hypothetical protein ABW252_14405 [Polyangiales bacterium]